MALLLLIAVFGFFGKGSGLGRLWSVSADLNKAARKRIPENKAEITDALQSQSQSFAKNVFSTKVLQDQLVHYMKRYHDTEENNVSTCDIEELIHYDLLDQIGGRSFCEHVGGALTSLGILGTFFGLVTGLSGFSSHDAQNEVDQITEGIQELLDGMTVAFWTSIVGIIASVIFGVLYRSSFNSAYRNLDMFLRQFRSDIANTHSGSDQTLLRMRDAIKQLPHALVKINKSVCSVGEEVVAVNDSLQTVSMKLGDFDGETRVSEIQQITDAFTQSMQNVMQSVMAQMTNGMAKYNQEVQTQCKNLETLSVNLESTVSSVGKMIIRMEDFCNDYLEFMDTVKHTNESVQDGFTNIQKLSKKNMQVTMYEEQLLKETMNTVQESRDVIGGVNESAENLLQSLSGSVSSANDEIVQRVNEFNLYLQDCMESYMQSTNAYLETALAIVSDSTEKDLAVLKSEAREEMRVQTDRLKALQETSKTIFKGRESDAAKLGEIEELIRQQTVLINRMDNRLKDVEKRTGSERKASFLEKLRRKS